MNKTRMLTIAVIGIAAITTSVFGAGYYFKDSNNDSSIIENKSTILSISYLEGQVEYKDVDSGWYTAEVGTELSTGFSIRTFADSKVSVNFPDTTSVRLYQNSEATFNTLLDDQITITDNKGVIYSRVAENPNREFTIIAAGDTYTAKGTAYKVFNFDNHKGVDVYQSKVGVTSFDLEQKEVKEGQRLYKFNTVKPEKENVIEKIDKESIRMNDFVMWNRELDMQNATYKKKLGYLDDLVAPNLKLVYPTSNVSTDDASILLKGKTEVDAKVRANGKLVENKKGSFSKSYELILGVNKFKVTATDKAGNTTTKSITVTRNAKPTPVSVSTGITLSAYKTRNGIKISWSVNGIDITDGFKLVWSKSHTPVFGQDDAKYLSDSRQRSIELPFYDAQIYYIRVCRYVPDGHTCDNYSNLVVIQALNKKS